MSIFQKNKKIVFFGMTVTILFSSYSGYPAEPNSLVLTSFYDSPEIDSVFLSPPVSESTAEPRRISVQTLISEIAAKHPAVIQAERETDALYGEWIQAGLKSNPELSYIGEEIGGENKMGRQGIALSQELVSRKKLDARQAAAASEQRAASRETEIRIQKAKNDAALAGWTLLIAQERVRTSEEILTLCKKAAETTEAMVNAGEVPVTDLLADQVELAGAESVLAEVRQEQITASNQIAVLLGEPISSGYVITDSLAEFPTEIDENRIWTRITESSPLLRKAYAEYEAACIRVRRESAEAGIDITAGGAVQYNTFEDQTEVNVGLTLPVRVHNRNQGKILRAQYEAEAARSNIERTEMLLRKEFQSQLNKFQTARSKVLLYRESLLAKVEKSYEMISESYARGECSIIELLDAGRKVYSVRMNYLNDLADLVTSRTLLDGYLLQGADE